MFNVSVKPKPLIRISKNGIKKAKLNNLMNIIYKREKSTSSTFAV